MYQRKEQDLCKTLSPSLGHPLVGVRKSVPTSRAELYTKILGMSQVLRHPQAFSLWGVSDLKVSNLGELMPSNSKGLRPSTLGITPMRSFSLLSPREMQECRQEGDLARSWVRGGHEGRETRACPSPPHLEGYHT